MYNSLTSGEGNILHDIGPYRIIQSGTEYSNFVTPKSFCCGAFEVARIEHLENGKIYHILLHKQQSESFQTMLASEKILGIDWSTADEDKAWEHI